MSRRVLSNPKPSPSSPGPLDDHSSLAVLLAALPKSAVSTDRGRLQHPTRLIGETATSPQAAISQDRVVSSAKQRRNQPVPTSPMSTYPKTRTRDATPYRRAADTVPLSLPAVRSPTVVVPTSPGLYKPLPKIPPYPSKTTNEGARNEGNEPGRRSTGS